MLPVAFLASFLVFMVVRLIPGDPAMFAAGGENQTSEEAMQLARARMGLNDPCHIQYFKWLGGAVQGDFGISMNKGVPVTDILTSAFPSSDGFMSGFAMLFEFAFKRGKHRGCPILDPIGFLPKRLPPAKGSNTGSIQNLEQKPVSAKLDKAC